MTTVPPLLALQHISRHFQTGDDRLTVLDNINLDIHAGEMVAIIGASGSGKSTLVRLMAALDRPTAGTVMFDGLPVTGVPERRLGFLRSRVQMVFQDPRGSLDPRMRARDIVAEPLVSPIVRRELGEFDRAQRVREVLDEVGLPPDAGDRYPHEFSGGQRQRIAIARHEVRQWLAPRPWARG